MSAVHSLGYISAILNQIQQVPFHIQRFSVTKYYIIHFFVLLHFGWLKLNQLHMYIIDNDYFSNYNN